MSQPDHLARYARRVRAAGHAALAFTAVQVWALPAPLSRVAGHWRWSIESLVSVGLMFVAGVAALRGSRFAGMALGAYGMYRLGWFALEVGHVLDGTAAREARGPAFVLGAAVAVPFAVFWVRGALAAQRVPATIGDSAI